jgi:ankyrin repeat protein
MELEKDMKSENGMSEALPKFSQSDISNVNTSSFGLDNTDFFDTNSSIISEFMSLSLNAKIEKFKSDHSYRKLKDKNSSNTFLHYICMNDDNYPMMNLIRPTAKEMDAQNNLSQTPLHISIINKNYKITNYLVKNGANVNLSDNNLNTSLHLAVKNGDTNIVMLLIKYRANPLLLNKNNETVLDLAIKLNHKECIDLLKGISLTHNTNNNNKNKQKSQKNSNNITNLKQNFSAKSKDIKNGNNIIRNTNINDLTNFSNKYNYMENTNTTYIPNKNYNITNLDNNNTKKRENIFLSKTDRKSKQRTNSTSIVNAIQSNTTYQDNIYTKKIVGRSQSGSAKNQKIFQTESHNPNVKRKNIISNNLFIPSPQNNIPRKTDFPMQNEMFLECGNESEEEEESIIRETPEGAQTKAESNLKYLKTIKITPLTETNDKKNPYSQIDSYVSSIHKNDQGITESDGYIKEDGLFIIEPSIDISNADDLICEPNQTKIVNEEIKDEKKEEKILIKDDLHTFLKNIGMEQYNDLLVNEGFDDINLIISQMKSGLPINDDVLREIGIEKPGDRAKILIRIQEVSRMFGFKIPFESVYHINKKQFQLLKYDFHVKAVQNWLKKLKLEKYLENFYNNGYYSPELIFIQKASKFPINDIILERDLKIENVNDRKLIMSSISSNANSYIAELQKISTKKKKTNNESTLKNKEKEENKCFIF